MLRTTVRLATLVVALFAVSSCGGEAVVESEQLVGEDDSTGELSSEIRTATPVGTVLKATTNVNLRTGAGTRYKVVTVIPKGAKVTTIERTAPVNGFYKVKYGAKRGWTHGRYFNVVSVPGKSSGSSSPSGPREIAIAKRAKPAMGFSYWWGHGRFRPEGPTRSTKGSCSGSCPSCRHGGSYGGDCSGLAGKVLDVSGAAGYNLTLDRHPYSTASFVNNGPSWHRLSSRSQVKMADAFVYNRNGRGHIYVYEKGDRWGSHWAYECKGCSAGCVRNLRSSSGYRAIARNGW